VVLRPRRIIRRTGPAFELIGQSGRSSHQMNVELRVAKDFQEPITTNFSFSPVRQSVNEPV
jgi:hypothetical protein